ncbi:MAG: hypothetical protein ABIN80_03675 [Dyadobacter sp.]|uniref:hypothetical protein n=1 Tax=Dyadobacter sp. TaxID=1914288 RepID=UPI003263948D
MNGSNQEDFKEPLGDWLKESFDQFELTPRPSTRKRVFAALPRNGKRLVNTALGLLVALLLALYFVKASKEEVAVSTHAGKVIHVEKVITPRHLVPVKRMATSSSEKTAPELATVAKQPDRSVRVAAVHQSSKAASGNVHNEVVPKKNQESQSKSQSQPEAVHDSLSAIPPGTLLASLPIIALKPLETSLPVWPKIVADSNAPAPVLKKKATGWFLSVIPSQNFQMLYVRSNPQMVIENIRFAGLSSMQSKGIKLAAGFERWGFKWSAAYTLLQYRTRFDIGDQKIEIEQTGPDQYKIKRHYTSTNEISQDLRFIGLGIARQFNFRVPALRSYSAAAGLEYTRSLSSDQGLAMVNVSLSRKLPVQAPFQISVGPYVEVGIHDLKIRSMGWHYRPYQVGLSVTLSGAGKKE